MFALGDLYCIYVVLYIVFVWDSAKWKNDPIIPDKHLKLQGFWHDEYVSSCTQDVNAMFLDCSDTDFVHILLTQVSKTAQLDDGRTRRGQEVMYHKLIKQSFCNILCSCRGKHVALRTPDIKTVQ